MTANDTTRYILYYFRLIIQLESKLHLRLILHWKRLNVDIVQNTWYYVLK